MVISSSRASRRATGRIGGVLSHSPVAGGIELRCSVGAIRVLQLDTAAIRVRVSATCDWRDAADWDVLPSVSGLAGAPVVVDEHDYVRIELGTAVVRVARRGGAIEFLDRTGRSFAADDGDGVAWDDHSIWVSKICAAGERQFGFGERSEPLDRTYGVKTFWNSNAGKYGGATDEMYSSIPFFLSLAPHGVYGCFVNTAGWSRVSRLPSQEFCTLEQTGRELDYVIIGGTSPAEVIERFTGLVGRHDLPPYWALGYHQSHNGYDSAAAIRQVAAEFVRRRIPCSALYLDADYMNGFRVFSWDPQRFPDPAALLEELRASDLHVVTIVDPCVKYEPGGTDGVFDDGLKRDAYIRDAGGDLVRTYLWPGECVLPDFARADIREWWARLHVALTEPGVAGIWNDMNEPGVFLAPAEGEQLPSIMTELPAGALQGPLNGQVPHWEMHNLYGQLMAQAARDAMERLRPGERSFVLTRSGFAGIQRHAAVWTGDNTSSWDHLQRSLPMLCSLGLSGVAFVGADVGGYWGNATPELYARWIQTAVLYPLMRSHSGLGSYPNEPWGFGPEVEEIARQALQLRYRLRPYLYTLFAEAARAGAPILRPMLWEFPGDATAVMAEDQVMLGGALLAAPVCTPGARARSVYLPAGRWFDWWTGRSFEGPAQVLVDAPLDKLPLFGRAGRAVLLADAPTNGQSGDGGLTLRVFPGEGAGEFYDDDRLTFRYRQGEWSLRRYAVSPAHGGLSLTLSASEGLYRSPSHRIVIEGPGLEPAELDDDGAARELILPIREQVLP
jgi:alpha-glucosidase